MEHNDLEILGYQLVTRIEDFLKLVRGRMSPLDEAVLLMAIQVAERYSGFRAPETKENIDEAD